MKVGVYDDKSNMYALLMQEAEFEGSPIMDIGDISQAPKDLSVLILPSFIPILKNKPYWEFVKNCCSSLPDTKIIIAGDFDCQRARANKYLREFDNIRLLTIDGLSEEFRKLMEAQNENRSN